MKNVLLILFLALASAQSPRLTAEQCQCSIEVTVKTASGEPLNEATVTLGAGVVNVVPRIPSTPGNQTVITNSAGRAVFQNLAEGRYTVFVQREGYFSPPKDGTSTNAPSLIVDVGPAATGTTGAMAATGRRTPGGVLFADKIQQVQQLEFTMNMGGVISGRVIDSNQQPLSGVSIRALRTLYDYNLRTLIPVGNTATTNDRGEYRLFWLSPGEYYVQANGGAATRPQFSGIPAMNYYPGTFEASEAVPVSLQVGQEQNQINFSPIWPSGVTISGTVTNNVPGGVPRRSDGQVNRNITEIDVLQRGLFSPVTLDPNRVMHPSSDNPNVSTFEIRNVPPGTYDFYFVFRQGPAVTNNAIGRATINVGTTDIPDIAVSIHPGVAFAGHLTITGNDPSDSTSPLTQMPRFYINSPGRTTPTLSGLDSPIITPDRDGRFIVNHINEGRYIITGGSDWPDAYVSDLRLGSRSFYSEGSFEIGNSTPEPLEIVLNQNGGRIQGTAVDAKRVPIAEAEVTLVPDLPLRANSLLFKGTISAADGSFSFRGIAPGSYKLFAWQERGSGVENAEFIKEFEDQGVNVVIKANVNEAAVQVPVAVKK